ncbi:MAG: small ribosomal subunit Rsm22 family protein [Bdellovibrionota bacterium]
MRPFWKLLDQHLGAEFQNDPTLRRGVLELSRQFTAARDELDLEYLNRPDSRRAYLAYYLPLNFEKVRALLTTHLKGIWPTPPTKSQHWLDLGCGPATASLAALATLRERYKKEKLPAVHIDLVDTQPEALKMARKLIADFAKAVEVQVTTKEFATLKEALDVGAEEQRPYDLAMAANVLNELPALAGDPETDPLLQLWPKTNLLFLLEPGHRVSSQRLIRFRERLLSNFKDEITILGPCPHIEKCPLYRSKHWCHFSEPVSDGRLTDLNMRFFKDPRNWLKFSYVFLRKEKPKAYDPSVFRAIGDLHPSGPRTLAIDLCQPKEKFVLRLPGNLPPDLRKKLVRGSSVKLDSDQTIHARTLTPHKAE